MLPGDSHLLVTARDMVAGRGVATFEGQNDAMSVETAQRLACAGGFVAIEFFDHGEALRVGRTQRLFTRAQRRALAARDGGCRFPGCTMPPAWTEAHHIKQWLRDAGLTDIENGILLCRFHHLMIHNDGWEVVRQGGEFFVVPPASQDPQRRPIPAPARSRTLRRLLSTA